MKECFSSPAKYSASVPDPVGYAELRAYISHLCKAPDPNPAYRKSIFIKKEREVSGFISGIDGLKFRTGEKLPYSVFPLTVQVLNNSFTRGFLGVSFTVKQNGLSFIWSEADGDTTVPVGFGEYKYFTFGSGDRAFYAATSGVFIINEDGKLLLKVRLDLLEEPSSIIFKFIFSDDYLTLYCEEIPGSEFAKGAVIDFGKEFIGNSKMLALFTEKLDMEYMYYKLEHRLSPKIILKKQQAQIIKEANGGK